MRSKINRSRVVSFKNINGAISKRIMKMNYILKDGGAFGYTIGRFWTYMDEYNYSFFDNSHNAKGYILTFPWKSENIYPFSHCHFSEYYDESPFHEIASRGFGLSGSFKWGE